MNAAEAPLTLQKMLALGLLKTTLEFFELTGSCEIPLDLILQGFGEPGHGDERRDALIVNRAKQIGRIESVGENRCGAKDLRQKNSEQLTENVAQREQIQEAQRMNQ